ncbi:MAG: ankyrin repeat domain-containing protein [Bacteroidota bacterium]
MSTPRGEVQRDMINVSMRLRGGVGSIGNSSSENSLRASMYIKSPNRAPRLGRKSKQIKQIGGYNTTLSCHEGELRLHIAAANHDCQLLEYLISKGADINARDNEGKTPLHIAAAARNYPVVQCLISKGADINAQDNGGKTPLHTAVKNYANLSGSVNPIEQLIKYVKCFDDNNSLTIEQFQNLLGEPLGNRLEDVVKYLLDELRSVKDEKKFTSIKHYKEYGHILRVLYVVKKVCEAKSHQDLISNIDSLLDSLGKELETDKSYLGFRTWVYNTRQKKWGPSLVGFFLQLKLLLDTSGIDFERSVTIIAIINTMYSMTGRKFFLDMESSCRSYGYSEVDVDVKVWKLYDIIRKALSSVLLHKDDVAEIVEYVLQTLKDCERDEAGKMIQHITDQVRNHNRHNAFNNSLENAWGDMSQKELEILSPIFSNVMRS